MINAVDPVAARSHGPRGASAPIIWGLTAAQLHDTYWAARGVQCVRRGQSCTLQRAADLYLLIEPEQLILFDLAALAGRLTWHDAAVTRLRLLDEHAEPYRERLVCDEDGMVQRIERHYRGSTYGAHRVVLTTRRRAAALWMEAPDGRSGWRSVRRTVPWSRVDHWKMRGTVFERGDTAGERRFLACLVERWSRPDQSLDGIEQSEPGVWHLSDDPPRGSGLRSGPLWLGQSAAATRPVVLGPAWLPDEAPPRAPARPRPIAEVAPPEDAGVVAGAGPRGPYAICKRAIDVAVSLVGLIAAAPVLVIVAAIILLEDGRPIFFGHRRQGRGGASFPCWKFRTMHRDAERLTRELEAYNLCDGPQVFIQDDPRVTRAGRLLRATHLDELPQLWNVLVGQMSLVGPRPSPDAENQFCPAWRELRLSVRPGITGLWQVQRTREPGEDFQEWIRYDIEYVRSAGFLLDLHILWRTARLLVMGRE